MSSWGHRAERAAGFPRCQTGAACGSLRDEPRKAGLGTASARSPPARGDSAACSSPETAPLAFWKGTHPGYHAALSLPTPTLEDSPRNGGEGGAAAPSTSAQTVGPESERRAWKTHQDVFFLVQSLPSLTQTFAISRSHPLSSWLGTPPLGCIFTVPAEPLAPSPEPGTHRRPANAGGE